MTEVPKWSSKQFSQFKSLTKYLMKSTGRTLDEVKDATFRYISGINYEDNDRTENTFHQSIVYYSADEFYCTDKVEHIFMPNYEFCEWLHSVGGVNEKTPIKSWEFLWEYFKKPKVLLFPDKCGIESRLVWASGFNSKLINGQSTDIKIIVYGTGYPENKIGSIQIYPEETRVGANSKWFWDMLFGFAIYHDIFPQDIKPGIPPWITDKKQYKNKNTTFVGIAKEICESGNTVSPHFRKGHFRMLSSDRYKNKKGQWVFVSGCFVKGHASTVDLDNIDSGDTR
jgi:hypothetical protein